MSLKDKRVLSSYVDVPSGDPMKKEYAEDPSRFDNEMIEKFLRIVSNAPSFSDRGKEIVMLVQGIDRAQSISGLMELLRP